MFHLLNPGSMFEWVPSAVVQICGVVVRLPIRVDSGNTCTTMQSYLSCGQQPYQVNSMGLLVL